MAYYYATNAIKAIQDELALRNERFKKISKLWEDEDSKENVELCKTPFFLQDILNSKATSISISAATIKDNKKKHKEIDAFDYFLIGDLLENIDFIYKDKADKQKDKENKEDKKQSKERAVYIIATKLGRWYRLALKNIKDENREDEIWVASLLSKSKEELFKNLNNKEKVYPK